MRPANIDKYPDLAARYDNAMAYARSVDSCDGCKLREISQTYAQLVRERQKRDNDFRKK